MRLFLLYIGIGIIFEANGQTWYTSGDRNINMHLYDSIAQFSGSINNRNFHFLAKQKIIGDSMFFETDTILSFPNENKNHMVEYKKSTASKSRKLIIKNYCKLLNDSLIILSEDFFARKRIIRNKVFLHEKILFHFGEYYSFLLNLKNIDKNLDVTINCFCGYSLTGNKFIIKYLKSEDAFLLTTGNNEILLRKYNPLIR